MPGDGPDVSARVALAERSYSDGRDTFQYCRIGKGTTDTAATGGLRHSAASGLSTHDGRGRVSHLFLLPHPGRCAAGCADWAKTEFSRNGAGRRILRGNALRPGWADGDGFGIPPRIHVRRCGDF